MPQRSGSPACSRALTGADYVVLSADRSATGAGEILVSRVAATAAGIAGEGYEERRLELRGRSEPIEVVVLRAAAPFGA